MTHPCQVTSGRPGCRTVERHCVRPRERSLGSRRGEASRRSHRRGRLPRAERGHPGRHAALARPRARGDRRPRGLARARRRHPSRRSAPARSRGSCRAAARSSAPRARTRTRSTAASSACSRPPPGRASTRSSRSAARTRSASPRGCTREHGFPVVGVPKTIDNDLSATDYTFGFDTAVSIATEAIDRLHTTAESHNRVMVVEVMGRHTGWIAVMSGIAGGADVILIPEQPITVEEACDEIRRRHDARQGLLDRGRERGLRADVRVRRAPAGRRRGASRATSSDTSGWAASATRSPARSRSAPATRRA